MVSTTRGFAFAATEGPDRLVDSGNRRTKMSKAVNVEAVDAVLQRTRPLFVAFERDASSKKGRRGRLFVEILTTACATHGIMILDADREQMKTLTKMSNPSKWDVAEVMAKRFPEVAHKLPAKRKAWQAEDDRIGRFLALAAATVTWQRFRAPR